MKIAINRCYGGFGLSKEAMIRYAQLKGMKLKVINNGSSYNSYLDEKTNQYFCSSDIERHDPILIQVIEELGDKANGDCSKIKIINYEPRYEITNYDGMEKVIGDFWIED